MSRKMMSLVDDPAPFYNESKRLFDAKFLDNLLKETEESDQVARLGRSGGPSSTLQENH